jgi:hypothetical protein
MRRGILATTTPDATGKQFQSHGGPAPRTRWLSVGALVVLGVVLAGIGAGLSCGGSSTSPSPVPANLDGRFPHLTRVAVYVLENRSYDEVIGRPDAPYLNGLARRYALATRYYAIAHPSLPNYIALTGGSVYGITTDCSNCDAAGPNIVGQLDDAGYTWKAYFEELDSSHRPGPSTRQYNPHYNPFVYYETVRGVDKNRDRVVGFDALLSDLKSGPMADFVWIAPGVLHDGHNSSLRDADRYASGLVPLVLRALGPNGVLYLTWDEAANTDTAGVGGSPGGGHVALIAAGGAARRGATTAVPANHYALLRTIEAGFGLPALGRAGSLTTPLLTGLLKPAGK